MLTLRQIEVARAVMVTGTIAGAARLLNVSAPGISRLMKYTEASLGFRLFDRRAGRLVPSEQARHVFAQINAVFDKSRICASSWSARKAAPARNC